MSSEMVGIITPHQQQKIKLHISCGWRDDEQKTGRTT